MKYCTVYVENGQYYEAQKKLAKEVNDLLNQGWQLQGGVAIATYMIGYHRHVSMAQAMIKPTD